jgi:electron transport complex protein RnfC
MFGQKSFKGGAHPPENKNQTKNKSTVVLPPPQKVVIPLQQHTGSMCEPLVAVGDEVKEGQKIGESTGFISAPVHASISGTVTAIEEYPHPAMPAPVKSITIERKNGNGTSTSWDKNLDWHSLSAKDIIEKIREAGIVGLGGAAFPTHVKLSPPSGKHIEALIINGVECEPYLSADHRLMPEKPDQILEGLFILLKALSINRAYIGIEKNKPDAIRLLKEKLDLRQNKAGGKDHASVQVIPLKVKYPQGAEKQLIKALLKREVPSGGLPFDVAVVVQNVGTAFAVYEAVVKGKPLIERLITVSGDGVANPQNLLVRIGTSFKDVLEFSGGLKVNGSSYKTIMGGPMMGLAQYNLDVPVIKGTSGILILKENKKKQVRACIKCGQCVELCPMGLMPNRLGDFAERNDFTSCDEYSVRDCMECGVCTYVCSSARPLVHLIKYAKLNLAKSKQ